MKIVLTLLMVGYMWLPAWAMAQTTPLTISSVVDASFGRVEVTSNASGNIDLGTNDDIKYGAGYSGSGIGTAGAFTLEGDAGFAVDVFCENSATLANGSGDTVPISGVEVVADINGTGAFGTGETCQGTGTAALVFTLDSDSANNRFSYGVRIDGSGGVPTGGGTNFNTSNTGGTALEFTFAYQ